MKDKFSEDGFDKLFQDFDEDDSGTIDKLEMAKFIQKLLGGLANQDSTNSQYFTQTDENKTSKNKLSEAEKGKIDRSKTLLMKKMTMKALDNPRAHSHDWKSKT